MASYFWPIGLWVSNHPGLGDFPKLVEVLFEFVGSYFMSKIADKYVMIFWRIFSNAVRPRCPVYFHVFV